MEEAPSPGPRPSPTEEARAPGLRPLPPSRGQSEARRRSCFPKWPLIAPSVPSFANERTGLRTPGGPFPPPPSLRAPVGLRGRRAALESECGPALGTGPRSSSCRRGGGGLSRAGKFSWAADQNSQQTNIPLKWGEFSRDATIALTQSLCLQSPSDPPLPRGPKTGCGQALVVFS